VGQSTPALPGISNVNLFRYRKLIVDLDAEISHSAFNFRVTKQELHGSQVASAPVDQGRLGSTEGMGPEEPGVQPDAADPAGQ
jgi:hypothetical protein